MNAFRESHLQQNSSECFFGSGQIRILDYVANRNGVCLNPDKINTVSDFSPPPSELASGPQFSWALFLLSSFHHPICLHCPTTDSPAEKRHHLPMGRRSTTSLDQLQLAFNTVPLLGHFDDTAPTQLRTVTSKYGLGAILTQYSASTERVIAHASRLLARAERNYSITEREGLPVVCSMAKFPPHFFGRSFTIVTDHHPLCKLSSLKVLAGRRALVLSVSKNICLISPTSPESVTVMPTASIVALFPSLTPKALIARSFSIPFLRSQNFFQYMKISVANKLWELAAMTSLLERLPPLHTPTASATEF